MKARNAIAALLSVAVSLAFFMVLVEVGIRVYTRYAIVYDIEMTRYANEIKMQSENPRIGHVHRPDSRALLMGVPVEINADGFRDRDYPVERVDARRIVILGDSLTFGWGVAREDSFEFLLEEELSKREPTELINLGTGNYNTEQQVALFHEKGLKYDPDEVVLFYFINDAEPTPVKSRWEFLSHSRVYTFFWSRLKAAASRFGEGRSFEDYYADLYVDGQPGWEAAKAAFLALRDTAQDRGFALKVVLLPELHQLQDYPFSAEYGTVASFLDDIGVPHLDLVPYFRDVAQPISLWVAIDDAHPNALAHRRIARYALPLIAGEALLIPGEDVARDVAGGPDRSTALP